MRKKKQAEPILPFGKHKGKTLATVLQEEPSYLCWFVETVDGYNDLKEAIFALPDFQEKQAIHYARQRRKETATRQIIEESVCRILGIEQPTSPKQLDLLCDRLFNGHEGERA